MFDSHITSAARQSFDHAQSSYDRMLPPDAVDPVAFADLSDTEQEKLMREVVKSVGLDLCFDILESDVDAAKHVKELRGTIRDEIDTILTRRHLGM